MAGLLDLFGGGQSQADDYAQQPRGLSGMSNSLVGLGMGLLQPYNPWAGTNAWTNALQGYQAGSALDQRTAQQQQELAMQRQRMALAQSEAGRQAEQWKQEFGLRQKQFERGDMTDAQRAWNDKVAADPSLADNREEKIKHFGDWYRSKGEGDWSIVDGPPDANGNPTKYIFNKRTLERRPFTEGMTPSTSGGGGAITPVVPGSTLHWGTGEQGAAVPNTTGIGGAAPQSQLPPEIQSIPNYAARQKAMEEYYKKQALQAAAEPEQKALTLESANVALRELDAALKHTQEYPGMVAGPFGSMMKSVPGSRANDVAKQIEVVKANIAFDKLQAMRRSSPTGGALGNVSDKDMTLLQNSLASLEQSQTPEQFITAMKNVRTHYTTIVNKIQQGSSSGSTTSGQPSPQTSTGVRKYNPQTGMIE
jgi:hypothetical protein